MNPVQPRGTRSRPKSILSVHPLLARKFLGPGVVCQPDKRCRDWREPISARWLVHHQARRPLGIDTYSYKSEIRVRSHYTLRVIRSESRRDLTKSRVEGGLAAQASEGKLYCVADPAQDGMIHLDRLRQLQEC